MCYGVQVLKKKEGLGERSVISKITSNKAKGNHEAGKGRPEERDTLLTDNSGEVGEGKYMG